MDFKDILSKQEAYVLKLRREFHMYPETSWNETRTSKRVKETIFWNCSDQKYTTTIIITALMNILLTSDRNKSLEDNFLFKFFNKKKIIRDLSNI